MIWSLASTIGLLHANPPSGEVIDQRMKGFVESEEISGAVTLVADDEKILHLSAVGLSDLNDKTPMTTDAVFWIASMTKPVTGTAVMMMQEEGKLSVDDPVSKYLPEFKNLKDAAGGDVSITIKQCLMHTSGLSDLEAEEEKGITTLKDLMPAIVVKPTLFPPGSKWQYCQTGINIAGRIVEVVSGKLFPAFLQERLLDPLGMKDTSFYPGKDQAKRLAFPHKRTSSGGLEKTLNHYLGSDVPNPQTLFPMANGGLFSTGGDYAKFAQMILRGGEAGGKRYLTKESVRQMTTVQSGDLAAGFVPGSAWGLGWCIVREPQGVSAALSSGSFGHGGAFGTQAWIDPIKNRIYLLMFQRADIGNSDASEMRRAFQNAAAPPP